MANISKRIAQFIMRRPKLYDRLRPIANANEELAGYRKIGLRYPRPVYPSIAASDIAIILSELLLMD